MQPLFNKIISQYTVFVVIVEIKDRKGIVCVYITFIYCTGNGLYGQQIVYYVCISKQFLLTLTGVICSTVE